MDSGGGLTGIKWHLLMIERPFMSLPALSTSSEAVFSFVPSVTTMLQGTLVIQSLSVSSFQFQTPSSPPPSSSMVSFSILSLFLWSVLFWLTCVSLLFVIVWLHLILGVGVTEGVLQHKERRSLGVQLMKAVQSKCRWKYLSVIQSHHV